MKVTIWNEYYHDKVEDNVKAIYPNGMHECIKSFLESDDVEVTCATLDMPECGLTQEVVDNTDVMLWWGHIKHQEVPDEIAARVATAVLNGMGLVVLHSGHHSKVFRKLVGTTGNLSWGDDVPERIWCTKPGHPIAEGIPEHFELEKEEVYGEPFDIPNPDDVIFTSWYKTGYVFRSGCTFTRGHGRIFYFQPGHESNPTFHNKYVQRIIKNAVNWVKPYEKIAEIPCPYVKSLED